MINNLNLRNDIAKYLCLDELITLNKSGTDRFGGPYDGLNCSSWQELSNDVPHGYGASDPEKPASLHSKHTVQLIQRSEAVPLKVVWVESIRELELSSQ